jgi:hypothetical protein
MSVCYDLRITIYIFIVNGVLKLVNNSLSKKKKFGVTIFFLYIKKVMCTL